MTFEWSGDNGFSVKETAEDRGGMKRIGAFAGSCWHGAWRRGATRERIPLADRKSGYDFMGPQSRQAMQDDDTSNPGRLWVLDGEALWNQKAGTANQSCAGCHGDATQSMNGVAARYPAFNVRARSADRCRAVRSTSAAPSRQQALAVQLREPRIAGADRLRGAAVARHADRRRRTSKTKLVRRIRAARFSNCARASSICPARNATTTTGARSSPARSSRKAMRPAIRFIAWNGRRIGSLQRRLRNCLVGMRAEPYAPNADEYTDLALYPDVPRARHEGGSAGGATMKNARPRTETRRCY